jgi:hypothetical protein
MADENFIRADRLLPSAWKLNNGRFDDGVEDRGVLIGTPVSLRGPYIRQLMERHGVSDYELDNNLCLACGEKCERGQRCKRCVAENRKPVRIG